MSAYTLCVLAVLSGGNPSLSDWQLVSVPSTPVSATIRSQSPVYDEFPQPIAFYIQQNEDEFQPPVQAPRPSTPRMGTPYSTPPTIYQPFVGPVPSMDPYWGGPPCGWATCGGGWGLNGPQPVRFGWTHKFDYGLLPKSETSGPGNFGQFGVQEFDFEFEYNSLPVYLSSGWLFSLAPQINMRLWDGPDTGSQPGLAGNAYRFGLDLGLETPFGDLWSVEFHFNPAFATDFEQGLTSIGWNLDGHGVMYYRAAPDLMYAFGAGFWDRVNDRVIPYAGLVWTPNDWWEYRLVFPKPRISHYLGMIDGYQKWLYVSGEYHVEAYEVELQGTGMKEQIELADWRIMLGLRMVRGSLSGFLEGGVVFGREVDFLKGTPGFDVGTGGIVRVGFRF